MSRASRTVLAGALLRCFSVPLPVCLRIHRNDTLTPPGPHRSSAPARTVGRAVRRRIDIDIFGCSGGLPGGRTAGSNHPKGCSRLPSGGASERRRPILLIAREEIDHGRDRAEKIAASQALSAKSAGRLLRSAAPLRVTQDHWLPSGCRRSGHKLPFRAPRLGLKRRKKRPASASGPRATFRAPSRPAGARRASTGAPTAEIGRTGRAKAAPCRASNRAGHITQGEKRHET